MDYSVGPDSNEPPGDPIDGAIDSGTDREGGALDDGGTAALVQRDTNALVRVSTIPIRFVDPMKAGNLVVVIVAIEKNGVTVGSIADDAPGGSNTYVSTNQRSLDTSCDDVLEIWYAANIRPGAKVVTVTLSAPADVEGWVTEFAGLSKTDPFDTGRIINNQPQATTITAPTVSPGAPSALVISAAMTCGDITGLKAGSAFQPLPILNGETAAYLFASKPGSYGAVWNNSNDTWNATTVTFK